MLGRTNTGGGGVGGVLTVTAPAGVTVSVSKDGKVKTKTANAEGLAVFKGLKTGTWQLTITDGSQVSTKPVVITADYSTVIAFFMATISITYPAGSTCTCSDGVTTLTAPDTSGTWECIVPNTGTWTVAISNGEEMAEEAVEITADGQSVSLDIGYEFYLFKSGEGKKVDFYTAKNNNASVTITNDVISMSYTTTSDGESAFRTENPVDLTPYKTIHFMAKCTAQNTMNNGMWGGRFMASTKSWTAANSSLDTNANIVRVTADSTWTDYKLDISNLPYSTSGYYVGAWGGVKMEITDIWLERR